jgi:hypothetical protein
MAGKPKEINLKVEFNPGTMKYEPVLPLRKAKKKIKFEWGSLIILIIMIILITLGFLLALKYKLIP